MQLSQCPDSNVSICTGTEALPVAMVVYNSLSRNVTTVVRVPVSVAAVKVTDALGNAVTADVVASNAYDVEQGGQAYNAIFSVALPAVGYSTYFIEAAATEAVTAAKEAMDAAELQRRLRREDDSAAAATIIANEFLSVAVDSTTGLLTQIANKQTGTVISVSQVQCPSCSSHAA